MLMTIAAAVFVFGLLVLAHELGHFITAKMTGMRVDEFAVGFGPKIFGRKYGETVYSLRAIPLGGFNDIAGMNPEDNTAGERGYCKKSIPARMLVISAGSLMNFFLPIVLFFLIFFFSGVQTPSSAPVIGSVIEGKAAAEAGLMAGDRILSIDGGEIATWENVVESVRNHGQDEMTVVYERGGEKFSVVVTPYYDDRAKRSLMGITGTIETTHPGFFESIGLAVERTATTLYAMGVELVRIFGSPTEAELAGPIGVAQMAGQFAERGFVPLLSFAAFLSLNLGIINLFPIPALDGGHLLTLAVEAVRGKPMSPKTMSYTQSVGIVLLVLLMIFATKNDIVRIFTGS